MAKKLPKINYKKKRCSVDFRLEELRCGSRKTGLKSIKFVDMPEGKHSAIKKKLRGLRFRTSSQWYIEGLDD